MNKEFKLPEKWYIVWENRENFEIISSYFKLSVWSYSDDYTHGSGGVNYKNQYFNSDSLYRLDLIKDCTKITIYEFRKYLLNEETEPENYFYLTPILQKYNIK